MMTSYLDNLVFLLISDDVVVVLMNFFLVSATLLVVLQEGKEEGQRDGEKERGERERWGDREEGKLKVVPSIYIYSISVV